MHGPRAVARIEGKNKFLVSDTHYSSVCVCVYILWKQYEVVAQLFPARKQVD